MNNFNESLHKSQLTKYRIQLAKLMTGEILDVGGGLGVYLPYFNGRATVMDISKEALEQLDYPNKIIGDAVAIPLEDDGYDSIFACAVCQYFDIDQFIAEALRVSKRGSKIIILVPNGKSPWDKLKKAFGMKTWWDQEGILTQYTVKDLRKYGKVTGEIRFLPFEFLFRKIPQIGHTLILTIINGKVK